MKNKDKALIKDAVKYVKECCDFFDDEVEVIFVPNNKINQYYAHIAISRQRNQSTIKINKTSWARVNDFEKYFLVIHELAHAVADRVYGFNIQDHGKEWRFVMRHLGIRKPKAFGLIKYDLNRYKLKAKLRERYTAEYAVGG